jgi:hypothetical protein
MFDPSKLDLDLDNNEENNSKSINKKENIQSSDNLNILDDSVSNKNEVIKQKETENNK